MSRTHHNPRLIKGDRSYDVEEVARRFGVHRNTVRAWIKAGLKPIDGGRPTLIQGRVLRAFIGARRAAAKRPCPVGTLYCFKCRAPRRPALGMVEFIAREGDSGNLRALCEACETVMNRRASFGQITAILPNADVQLTRPLGRIADTATPSLNSDFGKDAPT